MFKIKSFGNDRHCRTVSELRKTLKTLYRGRSVSVVWRSAINGLDQVFMLDVCRHGNITSSYGVALPPALELDATNTNKHRR